MFLLVLRPWEERVVAALQVASGDRGHGGSDLICRETNQQLMDGDRGRAFAWNMHTEVTAMAIGQCMLVKR